eukprot:scaffold23688_cov51-Phaeocystis_antarctica.AAC.4
MARGRNCYATACLTLTLTLTPTPTPTPTPTLTLTLTLSRCAKERFCLTTAAASSYTLTTRDAPTTSSSSSRGWGSTLKVPPWQCPSSAPVPPQGAPGGSGQLSTSRERATHSLGAQPPPRVLELAASKAADFTAFNHIQVGSSRALPSRLPAALVGGCLGRKPMYPASLAPGFNPNPNPNHNHDPNPNPNPNQASLDPARRSASSPKPLGP